MPNLTILTDEEIKTLYTLPAFDANERAEIFKLTDNETVYLHSLKSLATKIDFILQCGYFKTTAQFFRFNFKDREEDARFIIQHYFPAADLPAQQLTRFAQYRNQKHIMKLYDFKLFTSKFQIQMFDLAKKLMRADSSSHFIFNELLGFCNESQVVIPGYSTFQSIIATVLQQEEERLDWLLKINLNRVLRKDLDMLLTTGESITRLAFIKKEPKEFNTTEMRKEIEKYQALLPLYQKASAILPKLNIFSRNIEYYGSFIEIYTPHRLEQLASKNRVYLFLLCYIHQRFRVINDHLVSFFGAKMNKYTQEAILEADKLLLHEEEENRDNLSKAAALVKLYGDRSVIDQDLRHTAFKIVPEEEINSFAKELTRKEIRRQRFVWEHFSKQGQRVALNLRPIFERVDFSCNAESEMQTAITFMRNHFKSKKLFSQYSFDEIPIGFISKGALQYVIDKAVDPQDKRRKIKTIHAERYEFMFYQQLWRHIESGYVYVKDSMQYRALEDDLIPYDYFMANKKEILKDCGLTLLLKPITELLKELSDSLNKQYNAVNKNIETGENKGIKLDQHKNGVSWSLPYKKKEDTVNNRLYGQMPSIPIRDIIHFVMGETGFDTAFINVLPRYSKLKLDKNNLTACLIAGATGTGNQRMGEISDVNTHELNTVQNNFFYPEALRNANNFVINKIAKLTIFQFYTLSELGIHASIDGQKVETRTLTIYARYSKKYFGFGRGRSVLTLVANHLPINAKVIGTNDHESHHLLDVVYNNSSQVEITSISGDAHSVNRVNFALLYLFGYRFMPRFTHFPQKAQENLVCFGDPEAFKNLLIKPKHQVNQALIIKEWDNVLRILASLARKNTTQATIVKKLSSYKKMSPVLKALIEFDRIIMSSYMLEYIDDEEMRSNVQRSLNRGESLHQLMSGIRRIGGKKILGNKANEYTLYNECTRLVANCVIYYNALLLSHLYEFYEKRDDKENCERIKRLSPVAWQHINLMGRYEFHVVATLMNICTLMKRFIDLHQQDRISQQFTSV